MADKLVVLLRLTSKTMTAQEMLAKTGIEEANHVWKIGDVYGSFGAIERQHGVQLEAKAAPVEPVEVHLRALLKRVAPWAARISALGPDVKVAITCEMHRKAVPPMRLTREDLAAIAALGASFDVDVFLTNQPVSQAAAPPAKKP